MERFFVYVDTHDKPRLEWFNTWKAALDFKAEQGKLGNVVWVYKLVPPSALADRQSSIEARNSEVN